MKTKLYVVPTGKGLDTLIERVADKAGISEEAAARTLDVVLTAVKGRLPPHMAEKLVAVVAGEDDFGFPLDKMTRRVARATDTARGNSVRFYRQTEGRMREVVGSFKDFFKHGQGR
jgi:hypothetical protein